MMRKFLAGISLMIAMTTAGLASAEPLVFKFAASSSGYKDFSFTLDSNPTPVRVFFSSFDVTTTGYTYGGTLIEGTQIRFVDGFGNGGLREFSTVSLFGPQLFGGDTSNPSFLPGSSFTLQGDNGRAVGTLTISAFTAAVPEPATWALMLIGFGAVGFSLRRKRMQVRFPYA